MPGPVLVVAVDFSKPSRKAADAAVELAMRLKGGLVLVHALWPVKAPSPSPHDPIGSLQLEIVQDEVAKLSKEWAKKLAKGGVKVEVVAEHGRPSDLVLEVARKRKAGFIVVGSHGRTGVKRAVLGSVAESILRHADRPVLVVPA